MSEKAPKKPLPFDQAFEAFKNFANTEGPREGEPVAAFVERSLDEVQQLLEGGTLSREEVPALLAKLDIVIEVARDPAQRAQAKRLQEEITVRYPDGAV